MVAIEKVVAAFDVEGKVVEYIPFGNGHIKHVRNGAFFVLNGQRFPVEPLAVTCGTGNVNVGQELHFDLFDAVTLTLFASSAFDIETETSGLKSAHF